MPTFVRFFRWLFSARTLKRLFIAFFSVFALITVAWQFENWRGRTKWETWKAEWEAKGEKFDLASVVPPEVPSTHSGRASARPSNGRKATGRGQAQRRSECHSSALDSLAWPRFDRQNR